MAPHDREALERLCRCVQRPPLSDDRLTDSAGRRKAVPEVQDLKFKRGWDKGTTGIVLTPHQLLARLIAILPQPRRNLTHYHGVYAPAARGRADIVPRPKVEPGPRLTLLPARAKARRRHHPAWIPWAELLFHVFGADALECPHCDGRLRVHAVIQGRWATRRVLGCLGRPSATPRLWSARGPPVAA
ncbi:MAG: transposase [Sphaerospermopsis kisseleviana]